jgi:hypothetical protein
MQKTTFRKKKKIFHNSRKMNLIVFLSFFHKDLMMMLTFSITVDDIWLHIQYGDSSIAENVCVHMECWSFSLLITAFLLQYISIFNQLLFA